jgi:hypothetical protein
MAQPISPGEYTSLPLGWALIDLSLILLLGLAHWAMILAQLDVLRAQLLSTRLPAASVCR